MERNCLEYRTYIEILRRELVPAMGCTEPIAVAYCAAKAREVLGKIPKQILVYASGNIIKNVKSVKVPNTGGRKGMAAAAAAGVYCGDASKELEVISSVTEEQKEALGKYMERTDIQVGPADSEHVLDIIVKVSEGEDQAEVRIANEHSNIVYVSRNGEILLDRTASLEEEAEAADPDMPDYGLLTIDKIVDFAETCELSDVREILERQIRCNTAISEEGLKNSWGANIGRVLMETQGDSLRNRAKAKAAAGSDARMNGCELPVVINSGSGNQGITCSVPVIEYAAQEGASEERLYRALLVSNLVTIHEKTGIGRLSAYCGAVSAGAGAGAGIAWLLTGDARAVRHTVVNALAVTSGIICDGAKSSCAAKIAASVDAGLLGFEMYRMGQQFEDGDGLVLKGVENTIRNISRLGKIGMKETDKEIIRMMTGN